MATFSVTSTADNGAAGTLRWAVDQANTSAGADTIAFAPAVSGGTIVLSGGQLILTDAALTSIDGGAAGVTLDGNHANRIFKVNLGSDVALSRLTFKNGVDTSDGGAIYSEGSLTVTDSTFIGNNAGQYGGAIFSQASYYFSSNLTITNSTFEGNQASSTGGAISSSSALTVTDSTFSNNTAAIGGAIYSTFFGLAVTASTFSNNTAQQGGAIYSGGNSTITTSTFRDNSASIYGGGIRNSGTLMLSDSSFFRNNSNQAGGAIYSDSFLTVTNVTFSANNANSGGGILNDGTVTVTHSTLTGNTAGAGGAIFNDNSLTVTDTTISRNWADNGGGIYNGDLATINASTINDNTSSYGAGIYNSARMTVTGSTISDNTATIGGGGMVTGSRLTVNSSTLANNSSVLGGGIYFFSGKPGPILLQSSIVTDSVVATLNPDSANNLFVGSGSIGGLAAGVNGNLVVPTAAAIGLDPAGLQDNGGPTQTIALLPTSPAVGHGAMVTDPVTGLPITTDQRGEPRNSNPDIGAFETQTASIQVSVSSGTYNGSAFTATAAVTGSTGNLLADGNDPTLTYTYFAGPTQLTAAPANAGNYSVVVTFNDVGYRTAVSDPVAFNIAKANAAVAYSGYAGGTYDTAGHTRTVTVTGIGSEGTLFSDTLTATNAGSYNKPWSFSNSNYNFVSGAISFDIAKADAAIAYSGYTGGTYDTASHSRNVTVTGVGSEGTLFTDSLTAMHAGSYSKPWSYSSGNYNPLSGAISFDIAKANAAIAYSGYTSGTYDSASHTRAVTVTGVGTDGTLFTEALTATNAGSFNKSWTFSSNSNYNPLSGAISFDIAKANATVTYSGFTGGTYDSASHTRAVTVTGVGSDGALFTDALTATNAGSYSKPWSFSSGNYNDVSGTLAFAISQANTELELSVSNANPRLGMDSVTLKADVSATTAGPTGVVVFYDGNNLLGTAPIANGSATLVLGATALTAGLHTIRASFGGDTNFSGSDDSTSLNVQAGSGVTLESNGSLVIRGTAGHDIVHVGRFFSVIYVFTWMNVDTNLFNQECASDDHETDSRFRLQLFSAGAVSSIDIRTFDSSDLASVSQLITAPANIDGGQGDDLLLGGAGNDTITDTAGNNTISSGAGDDVIVTGGGSDVIQSGSGNDLVRAGAGNDSIQGGAGDDILLGGDGNDVILGGEGRDLVIGGLGADRLVGDQEEDILVAGSTAYDNVNQALFSLLDEWTNNTSQTTRRNNILNGTGQAGGYRLVGDDGASQTVFNDNDIDTLTGSQGTDWFFANREAEGGILDVVTDKASSELWNDTDF